MPRLVRGLAHVTQGGFLWRRIGRLVSVRGVRVVRASADPRDGWRVVFGDLDEKTPEPHLETRRSGAFIAYLGPLAAGGMLLQPFDEGLFLSALRVRPALRRLGVASELTRQAILEGERACRPVWLVVRESNHVAIHLFLRAGFRRVDSGTPVDRPRHHTMVHEGDAPRSR